MTVSPTFVDREEALYNARDVLALARIYKPLAEAVQRTSTLDVYAIDKRMQLLCLQMTRAGMPIDLAVREDVGTRLRQLRDAALIELRKYTEGEYRAQFIHFICYFGAEHVRKNDPVAGQVREDGLTESQENAFKLRMDLRLQVLEKKLAKEGVNFDSKVQQAALLCAAGVPLLQRTPGGSIKVAAEVLEGHSRYPAARAMIGYLQTNNVIKTFIDGWLPGEDGCIHPDWLPMKITGRFGSSPNVQNVSKRAGGGAENLRRMVYAKPGYTFVGADQKQLEARLIAACSGDDFMRDVFARNDDIHAAFTIIAFPEWVDFNKTYRAHRDQQCGPDEDHPNCYICEQREKLRDLGKRLEYGTFYGGTADTLWSSIIKDYPDIKLTTIQKFLESVMKLVPGVAAWRKTVLDQAIIDREIRSPLLGRREVFPLGRVEPTVAYNFMPQSGGADLWNTGAAKFMDIWDQCTDDARIIHNGHDSVLIHCRNELVEEVCKSVHACWEMNFRGVEFLMDVKVGDRWSEV